MLPRSLFLGLIAMHAWGAAGQALTAQSPPVQPGTTAPLLINLQDALARAVADPDPIAASQAAFMAEVASVLETPWTMSTSADLAFPQTRGERPDNFAEARQFEAALFRAAVADPVVHRAMMEVAQLLQPHHRLREPEIMQRIEAASPSTRTPSLSLRSWRGWAGWGETVAA